MRSCRSRCENYWQEHGQVTSSYITENRCLFYPQQASVDYIFPGWGRASRDAVNCLSILLGGMEFHEPLKMECFSALNSINHIFPFLQLSLDSHLQASSSVWASVTRFLSMGVAELPTAGSSLRTLSSFSLATVSSGVCSLKSLYLNPPPWFVRCIFVLVTFMLLWENILSKSNTGEKNDFLH